MIRTIECLERREMLSRAPLHRDSESFKFQPPWAIVSRPAPQAAEVVSAAALVRTPFHFAPRSPFVARSVFDRPAPPTESAPLQAQDAASTSADFNGDGNVDGADFVIWQTSFPITGGASRPQGDANGDGAVDGADFVVWQTEFPTIPDEDPPSWFDENLVDEALIELAESMFDDNELGRDDMLSIFAMVGAEGVTATELADLTAIVDTETLFGELDYVWKLSSYIVTGNSANSRYQGESLGNLAAGASEAHLANLVNKWFLGLDRPATGHSYSLVSGTLFVDGPSYADVQQGSLNDCAFLASLATAAIHSPEVIEDMFIVNGDGTYTVKFYRAGGIAEYVTVDAYLPSGGNRYAKVIGGELWVALAEKAYAQVKEMPWFGGGGNTYSSIEWLYAYATLRHITGEQVVGISYVSPTSSLQSFSAAFAQGELICLITKQSGVASGIVSNHAYSVMAYDATTQTVTLFNPWGVGSSGGGILTLTWQQVQQSFEYFDRTA